MNIRVLGPKRALGGLSPLREAREAVARWEPAGDTRSCAQRPRWRGSMKMNWICPAVILGVSATSAHADLVFTVSADASDTVVDWSVTGSATASVDVAEEMTGIGRFPSSDGRWRDLLEDTVSGNPINADQSGLAVTGAYTVAVGGVDFTPVLDTASFQAGRGGIRLHLDSTFLWPEFTAGTEVVVSGSGTFTLDSGTFGSVFNLGDYTLILPFVDGSDHRFVVAPAPGSTALFGMVGLFAARRRR